jgi:hypothetical protein
MPNVFDLPDTPGWPDCLWTAILLGSLPSVAVLARG